MRFATSNPALAAPAAARLQQLGDTRVSLLEGGLQGWHDAGAELFRDVNSPSKAFGELLESVRHTRSFIGAQSLIDAGLPDQVAALRNGTIGWLLAGQQLETGADRRYRAVTPEQLRQAQAEARAVADRAGVRRVPRAELAAWLANPDRTIYRSDVRTPEEYEAGHLPDSLCTAGGQLVQEIDHTAAVRGAWLLLIDPLGVRADMSGSWLAQMGWESYVLDGIDAADLSETVPERRRRPPAKGHAIDVAQLRGWLARGDDTVVIDLGTAEQFIKGHIPGALGLLRSTLPFDLRQSLASRTVVPRRCVLTCADGVASSYAEADLTEALAASGVPACVHRLAGGNAAWGAAGATLHPGAEGLVAQRIDRYRRPYEGTGNPAAAMQAYLDWEYGLVDQLRSDGTHPFSVM